MKTASNNTSLDSFSLVAVVTTVLSTLYFLAGSLL
jgi:hypothetical protein